MRKRKRKEKERSNILFVDFLFLFCIVNRNMYNKKDFVQFEKEAKEDGK